MAKLRTNYKDSFCFKLFWKVPTTYNIRIIATYPINSNGTTFNFGKPLEIFNIYIRHDCNAGFEEKKYETFGIFFISTYCLKENMF